MRDETRLAPPRASSRDQLAKRLVIFLTLYFAVLGLLILPPVVYSGDIGVKYVQAKALVANRFQSLNIPYPGQFLDPRRQFFPMRPPFVMTIDGVTQTIFSPASTVIQAVSVAIADYRGMILITIAAAALLLHAVRRMSPAPLAALAVAAAGLASPLWFYAISGWEHAPAVALGTAAFAVALTSGKLASAFIAGLLVGAGATIRDEVILLVPGVALAIWVKHRALRPLLMMTAGSIAALAGAAALEVWWFNRPFAAHLRHAVHLLQSALHATDAANPDVPSLEPMTLRQRYETVVYYWLTGYARDIWLIVWTVALFIALAVRWIWGTSILLLGWIVGILGLAVLDLHELITLPKWLAGLHRVLPYGVFILYPAARKLTTAGSQPGDPVTRFVPAIALFTTATFLAITFAGVDTSGGKSLGPRLLLPLVPLMIVGAIIRIGSYAQSSLRVERWIGGVGFALVAMTGVMHVAGTTRAYYGRALEDHAVVSAVAAAPQRVVVADDEFTAQLLLPLYRDKLMFVADSVWAGKGMGGILEAGRADAVLVSRLPNSPVTLEPMRLERRVEIGRMILSYWKHH